MITLFSLSDPSIRMGPSAQRGDRTLRTQGMLDSGQCLRTLRTVSQDTQDNVSGHSGQCLRTLRTVSQDTQDTLRTHSGHHSGHLGHSYHDGPLFINKSQLEVIYVM